MAWIVASNGSEYRARVAITCDTSGATSGGAAVVARVTLDPSLVDFWATVQSNGYDIRLATGGGSIIAHERASWSYAAKVGQLDFEIDVPATAPSGCMRVVYLYYGPATAVAADPSAGPYANTVDAWAEQSRVMPAGRSIAWTAMAATESAASLTPAPAQTVVAIQGERRAFVTEPLQGMRFGPGYTYNGTDLADDVDWLTIAVEDNAAAALTAWSSALDLRAFTDAAGTTVRGIFSPDTNENGMATLRIGWSGLAAIDKRVITVRAIAPAI